MRMIALIVAGGSGVRMGTSVPKQFLRIAGKPVLLWTIERFLQFNSSMEILLILPENQFPVWDAIAKEFNLSHPITLGKGGNSRFQSVQNGLRLIADEGIVFIHDGVRPLVSIKTLENCFRMASKKGNALPVVPISESIREIKKGQSKHVDRSLFRLVQTPQTFVLEEIKQAYKQEEKSFFTDDASVLEALGKKINLVEGNTENIKITHPVDLKVAELYLQAREE